MHAECRVVYSVQHRIQDYWLLHQHAQDSLYERDAMKELEKLIKSHPYSDFRIVKRTITIDEEVVHSHINLK